MIQALYNHILNIIAPPFCSHCKKFLSKNVPLCQQCEQLIQPVVSTALPITDKYQLKVFAAGLYQDPIKKLILAKSWQDRVASRQLGHIIWHHTTIQYLDFDYIVPIPLHWSRFSYRGFNQSQEIARVIAQKSGKPMIHALRRTKRTVFQSAVKGTQRVQNVQSVFVVRNEYKDLLKDKNILIVDDLMTTGATLRSAARELIRLRPNQVSAVVVARVK